MSLQIMLLPILITYLSKRLKKLNAFLAIFVLVEYLMIARMSYKGGFPSKYYRKIQHVMRFNKP